jgi:hypothetical protein
VTEEQGISRSQARASQDTSDFGVLNLDLSLKVTPRTVPNPLRAAHPDRLEQVRRAVRRIVAAQRAAVSPRDR